MPTLCKSLALGAAFSAGIAIAANADPLCSTVTGACQQPGQQITALPPSDAAPLPGSATLPQIAVFGLKPPGEYYKVPYVNAFGVTTMVEHYQVPPDSDTNVALHSYTSGHGPCLQGTSGPCDNLIPPSHHNR